MKKTFLVVTGFICFVVITAAFTTHQPPGFKNLKILPKDISEKDLDSIMHFYSKSLGVKCSFCHVHNEEQKTWDMASDANPYKLIARKMMLMTDGINKKYFPGDEEDKSKQQVIQTITCYSCHHGGAIPVSAPALNAEIRRDSINTK